MILAKLALNAEVYADDNWTDGNRPDGKNIKFTVDGKEMNAWETTIAYVDKLEALGYKLQGNFSENFAVANETSVENISRFLWTRSLIRTLRTITWYVPAIMIMQPLTANPDGMALALR